MKKFTTAVLATALLAGAASANCTGNCTGNFTGFFVGIGAVTGAITGKYTDVPTTGVPGATDPAYQSIRSDTGKTMFGGRLEAGYQITFAGCGYAAVSVYGTLKNAKFDTFDNSSSRSTAVLINKSHQTKVRVKNDYGVELKLGYHITKDTVGFVGIAAESQKIEVSGTEYHADTGAFLRAVKQSKSKVSAKPVIGLRTMFTKNLYLEAKYGYNFGSKLNLVVPKNATGAATAFGPRTISFRPRAHEFSVTIGWKF